MGRILRTGIDSTINYTFLETSAYDEDNPAATTSPWDNSAAMDQLFDMPDPVGVIDAQGVLVTFQRFPDTFLGAMVKVQANYDIDTETPAIELWVHNSETLAWTKLRRILFANVFTGSRSGEKKIFDLTFFPFLRNIDMVWVTMDPGPTGSPTMDWFSIQLFGQCEEELRNDGGGGGGGDPCADKDSPNYTGFDANGHPCPDETFTSGPTTCDQPDLCNEASIQEYRECLRANFPSFLSIFDAQLDASRDGINDFCAGNSPSPPTLPQPPSPNPLPGLDLCDPTSIDAFRASIGDPAQLANFDAYIDGLEASGFFTLVCPDPDPDEVPINPTTLKPDPDLDNNDPTPFGSGPGGNPVFPRTTEPTTSTPQGGTVVIEKTSRFILVWDGDDSTVAEGLVDNLITPLPPSNEAEIRETISGNYGPDTGPTFPFQYTPAAYQINVNLGQMPAFARVGVRCKTFRLVAPNELTSSIGAGLINTTVAPPCPPGPDWIITPNAGLTLANDVFLGDDYYEYQFSGANIRNNTNLKLAVPREEPTQNDALICDPDFKPRSRLAFQRGGCILGFTVKERDRWLHDVSLEDYAATTVFDYLHRRPYCIVLDIQVKPAFVSGEDPRFDVDPTTIDISFVKDAQPVESC